MKKGKGKINWSDSFGVVQKFKRKEKKAMWLRTSEFWNSGPDLLDNFIKSEILNFKDQWS